MELATAYLLGQIFGSIPLLSVDGNKLLETLFGHSAYLGLGASLGFFGSVLFVPVSFGNGPLPSVVDESLS